MCWPLSPSACCFPRAKREDPGRFRHHLRNLFASSHSFQDLQHSAAVDQSSLEAIPRSQEVEIWLLLGLARAGMCSKNLIEDDVAPRHV